MFKVLVWDYTGISAQWLEKIADMKDMEIVGTIKPSEPVPQILLETDKWNWLLIFEQGARNFFDITVEILNLPKDKIIYAYDINSWLQNPKATFALIKPASEGGVIYRNLSFAISRQLSKFITCTVDGISYIATSTDNYIIRPMYIGGKNHAANSMQIFNALSKKYYNVDESTGYFLDLGANIGTTCIYFSKKFAPNLKALAFEPDAENFKLLRTNLILNDMENKIFAVNYGLGNKFDEMTMYRDLENPGHNNFTDPKDNVPTETIKIIPLDSYLDENKIASGEIKYIWIDTEGFEPQVLLGAKNLLRENPAPIFMECNLRAWDKSGVFEEMMALLAENYSHFILVTMSSGIKNLYPLDALRTMERPNNPLGQIGDIFLIRRGAID